MLDGLCSRLPDWAANWGGGVVLRKFPLGICMEWDGMDVDFSPF